MSHPTTNRQLTIHLVKSDVNNTDLAAPIKTFYVSILAINQQLYHAAMTALYEYKLDKYLNAIVEDLEKKSECFRRIMELIICDVEQHNRSQIRIQSNNILRLYVVARALERAYPCAVTSTHIVESMDEKPI